MENFNYEYFKAQALKQLKLGKPILSQVTTTHLPMNHGLRPDKPASNLP